MEPSEYFDRYSPKKPENSDENGENPVNPDESGRSEATEIHGKSETSEMPVNPTAEQPLSFVQLGYGPEKSGKRRAKRLAAAIAKAIGYFAVYLGIQLVVQIVFILVLSMQAAARTESAEEAKILLDQLGDAYAMHMMIVIDLLFLAAAALIFALRRNNVLSRKQNLALRNPVSPGRLALIFWMGVTLDYAIAIPLGILQQLLPEKAVEDYAQTQAVYDSGGLIVYIIAGVILAPIVEELVFRGLISTRLSRGMPAWIAVLIAAAGFGILHGTLIQGLYAGLLGILLGAVFFREDSLIASIVLHFGFNFASLLPYMLQQNESETVYALYSGLCLLCIPISASLLIYYFMILRKKVPAKTGAPGVNAWLMRE